MKSTLFGGRYRNFGELAIERGITKSCAHCGRKFTMRSGAQTHCTKLCGKKPPKPPLQLPFGEIDMEWRQIKGHENYWVSESGWVWNTKRNRPQRTHIHKILGYATVSISTKGVKKKLYYVHRLVAEAFIPNPDNKREVNHINFDRSDNRVCNLEWVSSSENKLHSVKAGRWKGHLNFEKNRKLTADQVIQIFTSTERASSICKRFGIKPRIIYSIRRREAWASVTSLIQQDK